VSLTVERFNQQAEDSRKHIGELQAIVKQSDELPVASVPKGQPSKGN
jgi:hypothetical protein